MRREGCASFNDESIESGEINAVVAVAEPVNINHANAAVMDYVVALAADDCHVVAAVFNGIPAVARVDCHRGAVVVANVIVTCARVD